jgi:cell filamentation protein
MKKSGRYKIAHLIEDRFEPGSRGRVLKNKLGITSKRAMDRREN